MTLFSPINKLGNLFSSRRVLYYAFTVCMSRRRRRVGSARGTCSPWDAWAPWRSATLYA